MWQFPAFVMQSHISGGSYLSNQATAYGQSSQGTMSYQRQTNPQTPNANEGASEAGVTNMAHLFGGMTMQNQQPMGQFGHVKGDVSAFPTGLGDPHAVTRAAYGAPMFYYPNRASWPGLNQAAFTQVPAGFDASGAAQFLPQNGFVNYAALGGQMMPGNYQPYQFALPEDPGLAGPRRNSWSSNEENVPKTPNVNLTGNIEYHPVIAPIDRSPRAIQVFNTPSPHTFLPQAYVQVQINTHKQYYEIDLDALAQQDPAIPPPVPAAFTPQDNVTLVKCLENREGITNVYIRGFLPDTTDEMLRGYASRYGEIDTCKAMIDHATKLCKGFGFVKFFTYEDCENCIRGFFHLGYQASYAQKSHNSRLKDLADESSTNLYCSNLPFDMNEGQLAAVFKGYNVMSTKIIRDENSGISKGVGFARFETRRMAEEVLDRFQAIQIGAEGYELSLRFADTKAQKQLKTQRQERRNFRTNEYNYSVMATGSPYHQRLQMSANHLSPISNASLPSPLVVSNGGNTWTPSTSVSPVTNPPTLAKSRSMFGLKISANTVIHGFAGQSEAPPAARGRHSSALSGMTLIDSNATGEKLVAVEMPAAASERTVKKENVTVAKPKTPSPKKGASKTDPISPTITRKNASLSNSASPAKKVRSGV